MPNARLLAALQALTRVCAGGEVWKRSLLALLQFGCAVRMCAGVFPCELA